MATDALRVLLVEDVEINLELTDLVLRRDGFDVTAVRTGSEALEAASASHFDLVCLDLKLPDMDGLEVARRLKADPATSNVPIVAITALAMKGDRERALAAGCDLYITKPIDTRTLGATLLDLVSRNRNCRN